MVRCWRECGCSRGLGTGGSGQAWGSAGCGCSLHRVPGELGAGGRTGCLGSKSKSKAVRASPGLGAPLAWPPVPRLGRVGPAPLGAPVPPHHLWCLSWPSHPHPCGAAREVARDCLAASPVCWSALTLFQLVKCLSPEGKASNSN